MTKTVYVEKEKRTTRDLAFCGMFAALIAVGAFIKITIPVEPYAMHFTMQWFFVLMAGFILGGKLAGTSVTVYLLIGLAGVPVFASGGGIGYLIRPTFGFLLGFALAAFLMGFLTERFHLTKVWQLTLSGTAGLLVYYGMGMIYFYVISNYVINVPVTWAIVWVNCCLLTIGEDFLLVVLAALFASRIKPVFLRMFY